MAAGGCGRSPSSGSPGQGAENDPNRVVPPRIRPEYSFAEDLSRQYPEIVAIVQQFLETCLAGDYAGYRRLTSRMCDPESRERFQTVMEAIRSLRIQSIEPIPRPQLADEVFRVVSEVAFHPGSKVRLRRKANELAMLVLKEEGEWRIMPAPAELQPGQPAATDTSSAPASGPSYPWDEEGGS